MYRKIFEYLKEWKNSPYRKPLIIQGARQVGKTYSILNFGKSEYENYIKKCKIEIKKGLLQI